MSLHVFCKLMFHSIVALVLVLFLPVVSFHVTHVWLHLPEWVSVVLGCLFGMPGIYFGQCYIFFIVNEYF